jgi:Rrf2 family protein
MLSRKTRYGINALVYLTRHRDQGPIAITKIAEAEHIPAKFLEAILLELKNAGILASRKGKGGGYYLLRDPEKVRLSEIMRLFDGPIALLPCVTNKYYERCEECRDEATCGIRHVFQEVRDQTVKLLDQATLQEVLDRETRLMQEKSG